MQAAKLLGAGRVVAAGRNREALDRAVELGADATVVLGEAGDLVEAFKEAAGGGGIDVTVDPLWGEPAVAAIKAANRFARHVALGQSAGHRGHDRLARRAQQGRSRSSATPTTRSPTRTAARPTSGWPPTPRRAS